MFSVPGVPHFGLLGWSCLDYTPAMRVLGVDCGTVYTGYGVVEGSSSAPVVGAPGRSDGCALACLAAGAICLSACEPLNPSTPKTRVPGAPLELRLKKVFDGLSALLAEYRPDIVAIEDVFYSVNAKSALKLGHVRGVAMMAAAQQGVPVVAYAPLAIKSAVTGYGRAEKSQVQAMVARLLHLDEAPQSADAADALAIAICHIHTAATLARQGAASR